MRFFRAAALLSLVLGSFAAAAFSGGAGAQGTARPKAYGYVILNAWDSALIPQLRKQRPGVKVLAYKDMSLTVAARCTDGRDEEHVPGGAGYCHANASHPEWFLTRPNGQRINSYWFPRTWLMDVGNPGYQRYWLQNVVRELKRQGWDGVWADDADADPNWHLQGRTIGKYPTMKDWQAATRSMLATVGLGLKANGLLFIPNFSTPWSASYDAQKIWNDWLQFASGASQEYFSKWGDATSAWFQGDEWTFRQQFQRATEARGKPFLGVTYAPVGDNRSLIYARANFLLNATGRVRSALLYRPGTKEIGDPSMTSWTGDLGRPLALRRKVDGAWLRRYSGGVVVVNPSLSVRYVRLGGAYRNTAGRRVSVVRLRPATAVILRG